MDVQPPAGSLGLAGYSWPDADEQPLNGLIWTVSALGLVGLGLAVYASVIEPRRVEVVRQEFYLKSLPPAFDGYTLTQISDLHLTRYLGPEHHQWIAQQVNDLAADCIVITGDFLDRRDRSRVEMIPPALQDLSAPDGIFAVPGNHDYRFSIQKVTEAVRSVGVRMLMNEHVELKRGGQVLYLAGVDDISKYRQDLRAALDGIPDDGCVILLAHEPDYADRVSEDRRVALQLSGHTHGGQVRVPFLGAVPSKLPPLARRYVIGRYQVGDLQLYVNRGLGLASLPVRFNCRPEITHITLRRG